MRGIISSEVGQTKIPRPFLCRLRPLAPLEGEADYLKSVAAMWQQLTLEHIRTHPDARPGEGRVFGLPKAHIRIGQDVPERGLSDSKTDDRKIVSVRVRAPVFLNYLPK